MTHSSGRTGRARLQVVAGSISDMRRIASSMSRLRSRSMRSVSRSSTTETRTSGCSAQLLRAIGRKGMAASARCRCEGCRGHRWTRASGPAPRGAVRRRWRRHAAQRPPEQGRFDAVRHSVEQLDAQRCSRPAMALVMAGCERYTTAAALRKLRCSSTATNTRSSPIFRCLGRRWIRLSVTMFGFRSGRLVEEAARLLVIAR